MYQSEGLICQMKYVGQTGTGLNIKYIDHIHAIKNNNNSNSGYSNRILNTDHTYGSITDTMDVIGTGRKGRYLKTIENYSIYKIFRNNLYMNDTHIDTNPYFKQYMKFTIRSNTLANMTCKYKIQHLDSQR
jgi:hypothetical protein